MSENGNTTPTPAPAPPKAAKPAQMSRTQQATQRSGTVVGGRVPIVISYRKITKKPVYQRVRGFVGVRRLAINLAIKALDFVEDVCFESENVEVEPGEEQVVHWAIEIEEPWGMNPQSTLVASRVPDKPGCGSHYEVIRIVDAKAEKEEAVRQAQSDRAVRPEHPPELLRRVRPEQAQIRKRLRERLLAAGQFDPEAGPPPPDGDGDEDNDE
jgi:hypothetical protein